MNEMNLGNAYGYSYVKKNPHHIQCQPKKVAETTQKTFDYSKYLTDQIKITTERAKFKKLRTKEIINLIKENTMSTIQRNAMGNELCQRTLDAVANGNMSIKEALKFVQSLSKHFKI